MKSKSISRMINLVESGDSAKYKGYKMLVYNNRSNSFVDAEDVGRKVGGNALLLLHGTFSSTMASYDPWLSSGILRSLYKKYDEILAFDHPTVRAGIDDNYKKLLRFLDPQTYTNIDIIGSSRGGWLAQYIKKQKKYPVGKVVTIGTGKCHWLKEKSVKKNKKKLYLIISKLTMPGWIKAAAKAVVFINGRAIKNFLRQPGLLQQSPDSAFTDPLSDAITFTSYYEGLSHFDECVVDIHALAEKMRQEAQRFKIDLFKGAVRIPLRFFLSPSRVYVIFTDIMNIDAGYIGAMVFGEKYNDLVAEGGSDYVAFHGTLINKVGNDVVERL